MRQQIYRHFVISIANNRLEVREKCFHGSFGGNVMKIGIVVSGGDVSGMNNFIFQIARFTNAEITLFNGGITGLLEKDHHDVAWRDLVDFSIAAIPIITSGRTSRKLQRSEYEIIAKKIKSLRIDVLIMAGGDGSLQFLNTLSEFDINCFGVGMTIDNDVYGSDYTIGFSTACEQIIKEVSRLRNTGRALPGVYLWSKY